MHDPKFYEPSLRHRTPPKGGGALVGAARAGLSVKEFAGAVHLAMKKKRKLLSGSGPACSDAVALPRSAPVRAQCPRASWGMLAPFPFPMLE